MRGKIVSMCTLQGALIVAYENGEIWQFNPDTNRWYRMIVPIDS